MPAAIEVRFVVGGTQEVDRAFRSVEQAAARLEKTQARSYDNDARAAARATREKERDQQRAERDVARIREAGYRENARIAADEVRAADKAAKDKIAAEQRWADQRQRIQQRSAEMAYRIAEKEVRDEQRLREKHARALGTMIHTSMGSALSRSTSTLASGATGLAGMALQLGGGLSIQGILQEQKALERAAALFSNQTSTSPGGRIATSKIMADARATGLANNVSAIDVVAGMNAYFAKTGDVKGSMANVGLFSQLAATTGSNLEDIGDVAGALRVQNPDLNERQMRAMMLNIVGQTRTGAVDIKDLVAHVPVITSTSALYGGSQEENQRKLIGLSQVAMRTSGSSAQAATSVARLGSDLAGHAEKIRTLTGFSVKDASGQLKDPAEVIAALMKSSGGDIGKLKSYGIGDRSMRIFEAEAQTFRAAGGGKAGEAAVRSDIKRFEEGGYTEESLKSDLSNTLNTTGAKFDKAVQRIKQALEEKLAPYLERFADKFPEWEPKIEKFIDTIADGVSWLTDHPWSGVFAYIGASIAAEMAKAAIGKVTADAIQKLIASSTGAGPGGVAGGGAAGGVGMLGGALLTGGAALTAVDIAGAVGGVQSARANAKDLAAQVRSGKMTPQEAQAILEGARKDMGDVGTASKAAVGGMLDFIMPVAHGLGMGQTRFEAAETKQQRSLEIANSKELAQAIADALRSSAAPGAAPAPNRVASMSDPSRGGVGK